MVIIVAVDLYSYSRLADKKGQGIGNGQKR